MSSYSVAPIFLIRAPGVPFDLLDDLATRKSSALARQLLVKTEQLAQARMGAEALLGSRESGLSAEISRASRAVLRNPFTERTAILLPDQVLRFSEIAADVSGLEAALEKTLSNELAVTRTALVRDSQTVLPPYLLFGAGNYRERLSSLDDVAASESSISRNARSRERDRHLLLYLQRVCAKNDTFSEFGPSSWGRIDQQTPAAN